METRYEGVVMSRNGGLWSNDARVTGHEATRLHVPATPKAGVGPRPTASDLTASVRAARDSAYAHMRSVDVIQMAPLRHRYSEVRSLGVLFTGGQSTSRDLADERGRLLEVKTEFCNR